MNKEIKMMGPERMQEQFFNGTLTGEQVEKIVLNLLHMHSRYLTYILERNKRGLLQTDVDFFKKEAKMNLEIVKRLQHQVNHEWVVL